MAEVLHMSLDEVNELLEACREQSTAEPPPKLIED
jgi:hypothetical protein